MNYNYDDEKKAFNEPEKHPYTPPMYTPPPADSGFGYRPPQDAAPNQYEASPYIYQEGEKSYAEDDTAPYTADSVPVDYSDGDIAADAPAEPEITHAPAVPGWRESYTVPSYSNVPEHSQSFFSPGIGPQNHDYNKYSRYQSAPPPIPPEQSMPPKRKGGFLKTAGLALMCIILSGATTFGVMEYKLQNTEPAPVNQVVLGNPAGNSPNDKAPPIVEDDKTTPISSTGDQMPATDIYKMACNQVVGVKTEVKGTGFYQQDSVISGSGFIISTDGYILTNYHVIEAGATYGYEIKVYLHDGTAYTATVIGFEADNDIAVIKIDAAGLNAVSIGDNKQMLVGEIVYTVGNPLGELDYTMTDGIVSALDRTVSVDAYTTISISMFQISAAVNSGNSGGPVYNTRGEVIGIVSAKYTNYGVEGLGFAIPIDDAIDLATQLISTGYIAGKPHFGINAETINKSTAEYYNMVEGAYVTHVGEGTCAEAAGMRTGDIITKLGETDVTSRETLNFAKKSYSAGDTATVVVNRQGEILTLTIVFDEEPAANASNTPVPSPQTPGARQG